MVGVMKAGVPWRDIQELWEAGHSSSVLARQFPVITRQAIDHRAKVHHWKRGADVGALALTTTMRKQAKKPKGKDALALDATRTRSRMAKILDALRSGKSRTLAAKMAGISEAGLRGWMKSDPEFAQLAEIAVAEFAAGQVDVIKAAGERGDWRAALSLLERHPETKHDFAPPGAVPLGASYGAINVQVVLPPALSAVLAQPWRKEQHPPRTIEHVHVDDAHGDNEA